MDHLEAYPEYEDDVYFSEIRRQIMILTADDDDDCPPEIGNSKPVASDDVFCDDLRRQILLLTVDDGKDCLKTRNSKSFSDFRIGPNGSSGNSTSLSQRWNSSSWWETKHVNAVPASLMNQWGYGNGTGVFIPRVAKSRTRNKSGKKNKNRRKRKEDKQS